MMDIVFAVAFICIADTYLYWQHRCLHWFFPKQHNLHHKYSFKTVFHWVDQVTNWAIFPIGWLLGFTTNQMLPVLVWSIIFVFISHREKKSMKKRIVFMTAYAHEIHHKIYNKNYGVLTTFWDKAMGTYA